jgi:1-piperideine-2-carboxylate/1-pyrroline-2-carboxylate reductase [NAD(P)H]
MSGPLWLDGAQVAALLTAEETVDLLEVALRDGRVDPEADSPRMYSPAPGGEFLLLASSAGGTAGVKVVSVAPDNPARQKPKIQGIYVLFRGDDLSPVAMMDAAELTLVRTTATTVMAVKHMLRAGTDRVGDPLSVVVFGNGPQAERHVRCLDAVLGPVEAVVVGRRPGAARAMVERCSAAGLAVTEGRAEAAMQANVILCATSSDTPIFEDHLVQEDAVVAAIGTHGAGRAELPSGLVRRSDVVVETRTVAMLESGNLLAARPVAEWDQTGLTNLADLVAGRFERRPGHPAVYSGVGMAWQDLVAATRVYERVCEGNS